MYNEAEIYKYSKIKKAAITFRTAIEDAWAEGLFVGNPLLARFPDGSCGQTSELIGEYLLDSVDDLDYLYYVCGTHYPDSDDEEEMFNGKQSHAWISIGNPFEDDSIIVDITGDQFRYNAEYGYFDKAVYVGKRGDFHKLFEVNFRDVYEFHGINGDNLDTQSELYKLYEQIVRRIR